MATHGDHLARPLHVGDERARALHAGAGAENDECPEVDAWYRAKRGDESGNVHRLRLARVHEHRHVGRVGGLGAVERDLGEELAVAAGREAPPVAVEVVEDCAGETRGAQAADDPDISVVRCEKDPLLLLV